MLRSRVALLSAFAMVSCANTSSLRVMTWNIKGAQLSEVERLAAQIREVDPDVVALQELFFDAQWNGHVDVGAELARLTGLHARRLVTLEGQGPFGFAVAGQLVLTREPIEPLEKISLKSGRPFAARFTFRGVQFVMTHVPVEVEAENTEALAVLRSLSFDERAVLLGDLNSEDVSFETKSDCGPTFPADKPERRIDWVLSRGLGPAHCETMFITASDHLPLISTFGKRAALRRNEERVSFELSGPDFMKPIVHVATRGAHDGLCATNERDVYEPCDAVTRSEAPTREPITLTSVNSVDGAARFTLVTALPTTMVPRMTDTFPHHPLDRRIDVDAQTVIVYRRECNGVTYADMVVSFSNVPVTAKDHFDELAWPRSRVSIPGTAFSRPGLYFVVATRMNRDTPGRLVGVAQSTALWVE